MDSLEREEFARAEGRAEAITLFINDKLEDHISQSVIEEKLIRHFNLSSAEARSFIDTCMHTQKQENTSI
ncbi:MAG: hypothetical protein Q4B22_02165 [Eubacteriales bacterium]|nr:hypothetical protein [Eubacteriales bacterium]